MKIAFFDTKPYDRPSFDRFGEAQGVTFKYFETKLNEDTVELAAGYDGVCVFVNDTVNAKESHVVDLYATTPYRIITDENDMAYDVEFPLLKEGRKYRVAVADYVARNYKHFECENEVRQPALVYDLDVAYFRKNSPVKVSNEPLQRVVVRKK